MTATLEQLAQEWEEIGGVVELPRLERASAPRVMTLVPYEKRQFIYDLADYQLRQEFASYNIPQELTEMTDEQVVKAYELAASLHANVEPERAFGRHNLNALFGKASPNSVFSTLIDVIASRLCEDPQNYASRKICKNKIGRFNATDEELAKAKLEELSAVGEFEREIGKLYSKNKVFFDMLADSQKRVFDTAVDSALNYQGKKFTIQEAERFAYGVVPFADIQSWVKIARDPPKYDLIKVKRKDDFYEDNIGE